MKSLSVVLLTYNREEYARRTLETTIKNLHYDGEWHIHIADDGSPEGYVSRLVEVALGSGARVTWSNSQRRGYGANYNLAMQTAHQMSEYILPLEDDWELVRPLYADDIIEDMEEIGFGCARLGYIGYTQPLRAAFIRGIHGLWLALDPTSHEPHVFAGHPRIETVAWARAVGPWPENKEPGDTEFAVAHIPAARQNVGWPADYVRPSGDLFCHIGTVRSY